MRTRGHCEDQELRTGTTVRTVVSKDPAGFLLLSVGERLCGAHGVAVGCGACEHVARATGQPTSGSGAQRRRLCAPAASWPPSCACILTEYAVGPVTEGCCQQPAGTRGGPRAAHSAVRREPPVPPGSLEGAAELRAAKCSREPSPAWPSCSSPRGAHSHRRHPGGAKPGAAASARARSLRGRERPRARRPPGMTGRPSPAGLAVCSRLR